MDAPEAALPPNYQAALNRFVAACRADARVVAAFLGGSHARGTARPDSDLDVVILVEHPRLYLEGTEWTRQFGDVVTLEREDWGMVQALRATYSDWPSGATTIPRGRLPSGAVVRTVCFSTSMTVRSPDISLVT